MIAIHTIECYKTPLKGQFSFSFSLKKLFIVYPHISTTYKGRTITVYGPDEGANLYESTERFFIIALAL